MLDVGPFQVVFVLLVGVVGLLPTVAAAVFLWMCFTGRLSTPKTCAKCGAQLR